MASTWAGRTASPLYPEEAEQLGRLLASGDPVSFGQTAGMLASVLPPEHVAAVARQIDKQDRPLALALVAGATRTTDGRTAAELMRRGVQAVKDKAPETKGAEAQTLLENLQTAVGTALAGQSRDDAIESAKLIYYGKRAAGETITPQGALALALGGPLVRHNGRMVPVPAGMDAYMLADRMQAYPADDIQRQSADGWIGFAGARPMGVPEFLAALPGAQLEPAGRGKYLVRVGGSLALGKDGQRIVIEAGR